MTLSDSIYISTTIQTFTGNGIIEKYNISKNIATFQIIISYIIITTFFYTLSKYD